jgi:site-specific recombinase XerD
LVVWLEKVPDRIRARLAKFGLLDPRRAAAGKPLTDHLAEFEAALGAKGQTGMYVKTTAARVRAILDGCHFTKWSDIAPGKVEAYLAEQRKPQGEDDPGMSIRTCNGYIGAFKQFCKWMVSERRASESPVTFTPMRLTRTR